MSRRAFLFPIFLLSIFITSFYTTSYRVLIIIHRVKTFGEPVNKFKDNVTATEVRMEKLRNNLEDLRNHSDNAQQMVIFLFPTS